MKTIFNKVLDIIGLIIICIIIIMLNLFIGSNVKEPIFIVEVIATTFTTIYLIIKKIITKKNVIIKGKIDIAIILLIFSTTIPLLFNSYTSLNGTVNFIIKYITMFSVYLLIRNIVINTQRVKIIINVIIISSLIPIIFGIDMLKFNYFNGFLEKINSAIDTDSRFISTFAYKNTAAAYLSLTLILAIGMLKNTKNILFKILYVLYAIITFTCIILTESRMVIILLMLICAGFIFVKIIKSNNKKNILLKITIIGLFFVGYLIVAFNIPKPLKVSKTMSEELLLSPNTDYSIEVFINSNTNLNNMFKISIVEVDKYANENELARTDFSTYQGTKKMSFTTSKDMLYVKMKFINNSEEQVYKVDQMKINGKAYKLNYKYIPVSFLKALKINIKTKSVWQRIDYMKDAFKIIKENWILGVGGNGWLYNYQSVQDYLYYAVESHSYITELWISFGIIGLISYIAIISITIINIKNKILQSKNDVERNILLTIVIAASVVFIHSMIDFDMSFLIVLIIIYMLIAIINKEDRQMEENKNILFDILLVLPIIAVSILSSISFYASFLSESEYELKAKLVPYNKDYSYRYIYELNKQNKYNNAIGVKQQVQTSQLLIAKTKEYMIEERNSQQNNMFEILFNTVTNNMNDMNFEAYIDDISFLHKKIKNSKISKIKDASEIQTRSTIIMNFATILDTRNQKWNSEKINEITKDLYQILINEYPVYVCNIRDYNKNKLIEGRAKYIENKYTETYEKAIKRMKEL